MLLNYAQQDCNTLVLGSSQWMAWPEWIKVEVWSFQARLVLHHFKKISAKVKGDKIYDLIGPAKTGHLGT